MNYLGEDEQVTKLLIIADDFTGALDTGVQFTARGADTHIVTDPLYDFDRAEAEVLVLDSETRHLSAEEAYDVVFKAVQNAQNAGVKYVYKKTDSALRGNVGAELTAVLDAAGADSLAFFPAFPEMDRVTRNGIHYIDGVPVSESVFGKDPFEPVLQSDIAKLIAEQSPKPVVLHRTSEVTEAGSGIQLYDAESDEDLERIGRQLGCDGLRLSAGCAGFAKVLAECLGMKGNKPCVPKLEPMLVVVCGSMNPVTIRQIQEAEKIGFPHVHLRPKEKLDPEWPESQEGRKRIENWLKTAGEHGCFILDVNDPAGFNETVCYADEHGLTVEELRVQISTQLGRLVEALLNGGLKATILCTGGDTLLALMKTLHVTELVPEYELAPGVVLTAFTYRNQVYHIISKSGGFGDSDLFSRLYAQISVGESGKE